MDENQVPDTADSLESPETDETPERPDIPEFMSSRTVGDMLAAERRRQGKSLADIAESTMIRLRMLQALEEGAFDTLPNPAYVKGYIQNYATQLGLSPEPFLEAYRHEAPRTPDVPSDATALGDPILPKRDQAHAIPGRLLVGVVAVVAFIAVVWIALSLAGGGDAEPDPLPPTVEDEAPVSEPATDATPGVSEPETPEPSAEPTQAARPFEMTVAVASGDASWFRVTVDGEKAYEGIIDGGGSRTWTVGDLASVRIGRPSVVTITRDGEPVAIPSSGELPTIELVADE
jgi:cytoskeletal protein RodZ